MFIIIRFDNFAESHAGWSIPESHRPTFIHYDRDIAENELLRLQAKFPDDEFFLFKSVSRAVKAESGDIFAFNLEEITFS